MPTLATRIPTRPHSLQALRRLVATLWCASRKWRSDARRRASARDAQAHLRGMSQRELADLGIGPDQVDWFCRGENR